MKLYTAIIVLLLLLLLPIYIYSNSNEGGIGEETTLSKIFEKENIIAMSYWGMNDNTFLCIVTKYMRRIEVTNLPQNASVYEADKLIFYKRIGNKLIKIYEFDPGYNFSTMYTLPDNGNLLTIWSTGNAMDVYIFSLVDKKVELVLEHGTKLVPEIIDVDNDGNNEILITEGSFLLDVKEKKIFRYPETTRIYKWDGKSYKAIKTVPWKNRLDASREKIIDKK